MARSDTGADAQDDLDQSDQGSRTEGWPAWRSPVVVVAGVGVLLVVAALLVTGLGDAGDDADGQPADGEQEELVDEFGGSQDDTTSSFSVEGRWEIRWETEGETFQIDLVDEAEQAETVVEHEGQGGGSNYLTEGGTYSLDVAADGQWSIRIFEHAGS